MYLIFIDSYEKLKILFLKRIQNTQFIKPKMQDFKLSMKIL